MTNGIPKEIRFVESMTAVGLKSAASFCPLSHGRKTSDFGRYRELTEGNEIDMGASNIEWTEQTWNPIVGCSIVSPGCTNCYAMKMAARINKMTLSSHYEGLTEPSKAGAVWTGKIALAPEHILLAPLRRKMPTTYFVNSMGDLFHEDCPNEWIDRVFAVMALCPQHTFQVLTKRAEPMRDYMTVRWSSPHGCSRAQMDSAIIARTITNKSDFWPAWPLPNVWLGVSCERQQEADERIPHLLQTPAAVRFISAEPLLEPIDLHAVSTAGIGSAAGNKLSDVLHLVIVGGESGAGARDCWTPDIRSIVKQCSRAGIAVFVKQMGSNVRDRNDAGFEGCGPTEWHLDDYARVDMEPDGYVVEAQGAPCRIRLKDRKGGDWNEWPEDLRIRQMPDIRS